MWFYHSSIEYFHSQISLDNGCYVSSMRILCFASLIFLLLLFLNGRSPKRLFSYHLCNGGLGAEVTGEGKWRRCRIRIFIVHKEASFDLWNQSIHMFLICVSFLKWYSYIEAQSLYVNKAYTYELNLLGGVLSMTLKFSLALSMSTYLE